VFLEQLKRDSLVALNERAVADHVREHDRGELSMFDSGAHVSTPISLSKAENPGSGRNSVKPTRTQYSGRYISIAFSGSLFFYSLGCCGQCRAQMSDLVIHISRVRDSMSNFIAQEPPIALTQIVELLFHYSLCNAQRDGETGIRDIGVFCREIIAQ